MIWFHTWFILVLQGVKLIHFRYVRKNENILEFVNKKKIPS